MDIGDWLRNLGLGQYESVFRESEIDAGILRELTDQHLKDIGVALGPRLKILRAIRELDAGATVRPSVPAPQKSQDVAERRQLTVMFCDLVGSTALSERLDHEDLRDIVSTYHRCCAALIESNGGLVAKYMGDGVLAYFGYPQAHEDDAERAVQAGLAIAETAPKLETAAGSPLHVRIGIATGIVVVGDLSGSGEAQERGIVGDTPNLAARLQGIAEPGSVVIADSTRRLLGNLFELADLGLQDLKGIAKSTRAWAALRANSSGGYFEALRSHNLVSFVGRTEEVDLLLRRWSLAKAGEGQIVLLSGEAGIGKSRLTAALLERLAAEPHTRMRYFCSPQHTASALHPIIEQLERAAGINRGDLPARKLDKLDALLAHSADLSEEAALFAEMLSLPNDGRYPALELTSQARRQRTLDALLAQIEALAHDNPVLIIFEDAHWADPTTLEFFGRLIDRVQTLNVFLFMTFRPEFVPPPWTGRPHVTALTINRLARGEVMALIDRIAGNVALSANTKLEIVERTDGVPLFVEEMTRAVLEAEGERAALRAGTAVLSSAAAVPQSLHALLTARLDRLGEAKAVAQAGAAIGREFSHELLASVARGTSGELAASLDHLVDSGLLFRGGAPPHVTYQFKHALVRDAAYGMLLREPRRALHTRIVETIEGQFADIAENQPDLLAHHCTEAGLIEKAAGLWGKAGQRSLDRSALVEAAEQLKRALGQIGALAASQALRREEIRWQIGLLNALMHVKGYAAVETKVALERARLLIDQAEALGEPPDDPLLLYSVLYGFWVASYVAFNGDVLCDLASQMLSRAEDQDATIPRMIGHRMMGASLLLTGRFAEARAHQDKAIALYRPAEHRPLATRFGQDSAVMIVSYRAIALWSLGYPDAALSGIRLAIEEAREIGQAATLIVALMHAAVVHSHCGNHADARAAADELIALADEKGISFWKTFGILIQGCVLARFNLASDAVLVISSAITDLQPTGATLWATYSLSYLAKAYAQLGKFGDAERCIGEAAAAIGATGEKWCEPEVHRVAGEIALMCPQPDATKAEACFELALAVAQGQQACSWKLRAAMSMARLWRDQGKRQQAHDLLAPVYGWFTEGLDTLDLKEAKCLLAELADNTASERG